MYHSNPLVEPECRLLGQLSIPGHYQQLLEGIFTKTHNKDIHTLAIIVGIGMHCLTAQKTPISVSTLFAEIDSIHPHHPIWTIDSDDLKNMLGFFLSDPRRDTYWARMISNMVPYLDAEIAKINALALELID